MLSMEISRFPAPTPLFSDKSRNILPSFLFPSPRPLSNNMNMVLPKPNLHHQVSENGSPISSNSKGVEASNSKATAKFMVIGHRGNGMNMLHSSDLRMKNFKENSILSFNTAASFDLDFIEFDVQVTKDGVPIIFHDEFIVTEQNGTIHEKRVTELNLTEFLAYGPQKEGKNMGKPLLRKTKDGKIVSWDVNYDDTLCTLQEAFEKVKPNLGFNIELKFKDHIVYQEDFLTSVLQSVLKVVYKHGKDRPIMFSSFEPDAVLVLRKLQGMYPVLVLTNGGTRMFHDTRRNSLEEAYKLCLEGGLQGIVSEVKGVFSNPAAVTKIKDSNLSLFTYGTLNNVAELVYLQHLMGIDGVVVDCIQDIVEAVSDVIKPKASSKEGGRLELEAIAMPKFSQKELSFLLRLVSQMVNQ